MGTVGTRIETVMTVVVQLNGPTKCIQWVLTSKFSFYLCVMLYNCQIIFALTYYVQFEVIVHVKKLKLYDFFVVMLFPKRTYFLQWNTKEDV